MDLLRRIAMYLIFVMCAVLIQFCYYPAYNLNNLFASLFLAIFVATVIVFARPDIFKSKKKLG